MIDLGGGVPGIDAPGPTSFEEFWPFFVSQHLHPRTRAAHVWATTVYTAAGFAVLLGFRRRLMVGVGALAGAVQVASHRIWEHNTASDTDRVARPRYDWPLRGDYRLVLRTITGRLEEDVTLVREALHLAPEHTRLADAGIRPMRVAA